jgi:rubrerythrin
LTASASVDQLIQIAIQAERATEQLYRQMKRLFVHVPDVARFIDRYAAEEAGHVVWLQNLRKRLSAEKLAAPAIPLIYQDAEQVSQGPMEEDLDRIETLEDAYQLLLGMVRGQANQVLEGIINTYYEEETTRSFLLDHLRQHQQRIETEFPDQYADLQARQAVRAMRV